MKPEDLTSDQVREIGQQYLKMYPEGCWLQRYGFHTNQRFAGLIGNSPEKETAEERWFHLLRIYSQLKKPHGVLSDKIDQLFEKAFNINVIKYASGTSGGIYFFSTYSVVNSLNRHVNQYFKDKKELRSLPKTPKIS